MGSPSQLKLLERRLKTEEVQLKRKTKPKALYLAGRGAAIARGGTLKNPEVYHLL